MKLTPMDIHNKEFDVKLHGYDKHQVDEFLDQVINSYSDALDKITDLENNQGSTVQAAPAVAQPVQANSDVEQASELLLSAQKSADLITHNAQQEAERIIAEAKQQAAQIQDDAANQEAEAELNHNLETLQDDYSRLRKRVADFREKTKMLLQKEIDDMDDENWQYWLDRYYGTERMYPVDAEPYPVDQVVTDEDPAELDNETINDVESMESGVQGIDMNQIASGDNPTNVSINTDDLQDFPDDGPVIIFPEDLKK